LTSSGKRQLAEPLPPRASIVSQILFEFDTISLATLPIAWLYIGRLLLATGGP
jgi:hypothetical protein